MGAPKGALRPNPATFRHKQTDGCYDIRKYPTVDKFNRADQTKRQPVPKKDEKPIHGLVSDKNFIVANAVENILAAAKLPASKERDFLKKKTYGKTPNYMTKIKNEIEDEYNLVREM